MTEEPTPAQRRSRDWCCELTKRTGRNFYFSFVALPRNLRRDMCVLYAFMRTTDDIGDDEAVGLDARRDNLANWKQELAAALRDESDRHPCLPALKSLVDRHRIPEQYLFDVIDGVEMDLTPRRFSTFDELREYCYKVAGAVGLCCIHIWGYAGEGAIAPAIDCGTAFQLTNILRDLGEDAARGRVYLPQDELIRFGYAEDELLRQTDNDRFRSLMAFQVGRAREYYASAEALFGFLSRDGRRILRAMLSIYRGLLDKIEAANYDVFSQRISLSLVRKWWIAARSFFGR